MDNVFKLNIWMGPQNNYTITLFFWKIPQTVISHFSVYQLLMGHIQRHRSYLIFTLASLQTTLNVKVQQQQFYLNQLFILTHFSFMNWINLEYYRWNSCFSLSIFFFLLLFIILHPLYRSLSCIILQSFDNCNFVQ